MKTNYFSKIILALTVVAVICLTGCQKEKAAPKMISKSSAKKSKNIFFATSAMGLELQEMIFATNGGSSPKGRGNTEKSFNGSCAAITIDSTPKPYVKTYDYGTGCVSSDGHFRSGQVTLTYDNSDVRVPNNHYTLSTSNFVFDSTTANGTITLVNNGFGTDTFVTLTQSASYLTTCSGVTDTSTGTVNYTWLSGYSSSPAADWQFQITGGGSAIDNNGNFGSATIQTPLIQNKKTTGCNFFIQGTVLVQYTGQSNQTIDYGNPGGCTGQETTTQNAIQTTSAQTNFMLLY